MLTLSIPNAVLLAVILLTACFFLYFAVKYYKTGKSLNFAISYLTKPADGQFPVGVSPKTLERAFLGNPLVHLWREYTDTLHPMRIGIRQTEDVVEYRSSMPAEFMFTKEVLVEGPLFDDFFRHLPGILTGLGIIGTFAGLLTGLDGFQINPDKPAEAIKGLRPLLDGVTHAFIVSAVAIFCAMAVVFVSRFFIARLNGRVDSLCDAIDVLYKSGVNEEYLQRLVNSSENAEVHTAQLKDALVKDLTALMTNLTERQIEAQMRASSNLGAAVGDSIASALEEPMRRISNAMEATTKGNGDQVASMLEALLTAFMEKIERTFGGQMSGINEQMQRSMMAMAEVQASLKMLVYDIQKANETATQQMSGKLEEAMRAAAENQQQLTTQMTQFVQDFRMLVTEEQRKTKVAMDETIAGILKGVGDAIQSMEESRRRASEEDVQRTRSLTNTTGELVSGLSGSVEELLKNVSNQVFKTQESIDAIRDVSLRAIDGMNSGAVSMSVAAQKFESAGSSLANVLSETGELIDDVRSTSTALQASALAINTGFEKYDATRQSIETHVGTLNTLIEIAKREAGLSKQLIEEVEASVKALRDAERDSREHLQSVNDSLTSAFKTFGAALIEQLKKSIGETDAHINQGTSQLVAIVQEFGIALQQMRRA